MKIGLEKTCMRACVRAMAIYARLRLLTSNPSRLPASNMISASIYMPPSGLSLSGRFILIASNERDDFAPEELVLRMDVCHLTNWFYGRRWDDA